MRVRPPPLKPVHVTIERAENASGRLRAAQSTRDFLRRLSVRADTPLPPPSTTMRLQTSLQQEQLRDLHRQDRLRPASAPVTLSAQLAMSKDPDSLPFFNASKLATAPRKGGGGVRSKPRPFQ